MVGYIRQSQADIVPQKVVQAAPLNNEFNALSMAFSGNSGHTHDGTLGNGPRISLSSSITGVLAVENGGTGSSDLLEVRENLGLTIGEDVQSHSPVLDDIAEDSGKVGIVVKTSANEATFRNLDGVEKEITVTSAGGVAGNPQIGLAKDLEFSGKTVNKGTFRDGEFTNGTFSGNGEGITAIKQDNVVGLNTSLNAKFDKSGGTITGSVSFSDNITVANGKHITSQTAPSVGNHVTNKTYVDNLVNAKYAEAIKRANHTGTQSVSTITGLSTELEKYARKTGDTFTGVVYMSNQRIANLGRATATSDAVNLGQVREEINSAIPVKSVAGRTGNVTLTADDIRSGVFPTARIPNLDAGKVTTGIFNIARIPTIPANKVSGITSWPGVYSGTDANNLNFPVGSIIAFTRSGNEIRNRPVVPSLASNDWQYTENGTNRLAGTWRLRGFTGSSGSGLHYLTQRVS